MLKHQVFPVQVTCQGVICWHSEKHKSWLSHFQVKKVLKHFNSKRWNHFIRLQFKTIHNHVVSVAKVIGIFPYLGIGNLIRVNHLFALWHQWQADLYEDNNNNCICWIVKKSTIIFTTLHVNKQLWKMFLFYKFKFWIVGNEWEWHIQNKIKATRLESLWSCLHACVQLPQDHLRTIRLRTDRKICFTILTLKVFLFLP